MPTRYIKESIKTSDTIDSLSWFEEVLFYRLIVSVDDYGRFDGRAAVIRNLLFPLKEQITVASVEKALNKLASVNLISLYTVENRRYLHLPTWCHHQTTPRAKSSRFPAPEEAEKVFSDICTADAQQMHSECYADVAVIDNRNRNRNIIVNRESTPARTYERKKYGSFENVLLSDEEHAMLTDRFGNSTAKSLIDSFSCKLKSKGYKSDNHCATIIQWADEDGVKPDNIPSGSFDTDEFLEAALKNSFKKEEA